MQLFSHIECPVYAHWVIHLILQVFMKSFLKLMLGKIGLLSPLKKINSKYLKPRGIGSWNPLVPENEFSHSVTLAIRDLLEKEPLQVVGDYLEFGVSRGTSMSVVFHVLKNLELNQARLIGFDSFEGMPKDSEKEGWSAGSYHSTVWATRKYLKHKGVDMNRVHLVRGWFKDTLNQKTKEVLNIKKASIIMIDCDIYSASKTALTFSFPLIHDHAVLIFDDWGWTADSGIIGQKEAFEEIMEQYPDLTAIPLPNYIPQSRVFLIVREFAS